MSSNAAPDPSVVEAASAWLLRLGEAHGVNPWVFAAIYVGAIPFFLLSLAWVVRNARTGKSTVVPTLAAGFFFVSAYLYLAVAGRDIPMWVWLFLGALVIITGAVKIRDVRRRIAAARAGD